MVVNQPLRLYFLGCWGGIGGCVGALRFPWDFVEREGNRGSELRSWVMIWIPLPMMPMWQGGMPRRFFFWTKKLRNLEKVVHSNDSCDDGNEMTWWKCIVVYGFFMVFPKIGVPQNGWFITENPIKYPYCMWCDVMHHEGDDDFRQQISYNQWSSPQRMMGRHQCSSAILQLLNRRAPAYTPRNVT